MFLKYNKHEPNHEIKCFRINAWFCFLHRSKWPVCFACIFLSLHQPIRSILLHQSYNIMFCDNTIYCSESAANDNEFSWDSIFLIKFRMRNIMYCCSDTILLFLSRNKLYFNDQINCFVINSYIFLFSTLSKMVYLFSLYIFCLDKHFSDPLNYIRVII